jgi:hypothetical protein
MSNGNERPPVWQSEDWWACFLGWFIVLIAIIGLKEVEAGKWAVGLLPHGPKIAKWTSLGAAFPNGIGALWSTIGLFVFICVLTMIGGAFMKLDLKRYIPGFIIIFFLSFVSMVLSKQAFF